jgi:hypothetical protein
MFLVTHVELDPLMLLHNPGFFQSLKLFHHV